ncbi:MAG: STAS domain-containing protein [Rubrobacter sp.]|jgi:anti-anti-sigma factor|nr:STAS domain-containing protein [Rubrobacter sp.]
MSSLQIAVEERNGVSTLLLRGELDIVTIGKLARSLSEVESKETRTIVFDLTELDFIDSSGLRIIVAADTEARRAGGRVVVVEGREAVRRVFRHTLLDKRLTLVEDADEI